MTYRDALIADLPTIVLIYNTTIASRMVTADLEPVSVASREDWFYQHNPRTRPLWVVENDQKDIVGWVSFQSFYGRPAYKHTVEISIYLDEDQRGKGLGSAILQHSLEKAPQYDIKTILGFIFLHNEPSLRLFKKSGFEEWGHYPNIAELDHKERSLIVLGRRV
ncbi:GNAT family N-acetyltransferase [Spirochaeta cellobiosiphila]|uniref:GNAT family N-acetyltransferase n=1 Tax=Spirochaeta cellobiosiphila TaxID=504483 RepID=UPI0003F9C451|nr:GNAT family N-acetyltransferase [Spirochaeta cellobiosiphila]